MTADLEMQRLTNLKKKIRNLENPLAWKVDYIKHFLEGYKLSLIYKETPRIFDPFSYRLLELVNKVQLKI